MDTKNVADAGKPGQTASAPAGKPEQTTAQPKPAEQTAGYVAEMNDILSTSKSRAAGGAKIRPNVGYTLVADGVKKLAGTNVPEQEQVILRILNKALTPQKPVISEPELNKLVLAAHQSGALKTKQDAWHIFRYYRTDLIKRGALKQVEVPMAS